MVHKKRPILEILLLLTLVSAIYLQFNMHLQRIDEKITRHGQTNEVKFEVLEKKLDKLETQVKDITPTVSRGGYYEIFKATAYTKDFESTGKRPGNKEYGITASGYDLRGLNWKEARTIAVDPEIIPLGSKVYLQFDGERSKYNGWWTARDTGNKKYITKKRLDLFIPDLAEAKEFGVCEVKVLR